MAGTNITAREALSYAFDREYLILLSVILMGGLSLWAMTWVLEPFRMPQGFQIIFATLFGLTGVTLKFVAIVGIFRKLLMDAAEQ